MEPPVEAIIACARPLVVAEIAVALVLLTASGLLLRSFEKMRSVDLGFRPDHLTTAAYSLPKKQYATQSAVDAFNRELLLRLNQLPGVQGAGLTSFLPASGNNNNQTFVVDGYVPPKGADMNLATSWNVTGDSFRAMGIPLLRGRFFNDADRSGGQLVLIVNHKLAQHYWPNQDPIGKRLRLGTAEMQTPWLTVVGEVADVKLNAPDEPTKEQYFFPVEQAEQAIGSLASPDDLNGNGGYIVVRSAIPGEQMENALRATVRSIDNQLPLTQVQTMEQAVSESEAPRRFNTVLISSFACAAVLLAVLGIYSVIAFSVASRVQEMAIRMALGSQRAGIVSLILKSGAKLAAIGCAVGLAGAAAASTLLRSLLFGREPLRSPGADVCCHWGPAIGPRRIDPARAPRCLHRSHASPSRRVISGTQRVGSCYPMSKSIGSLDLGCPISRKSFARDVGIDRYRGRNSIG